LPSAGADSVPDSGVEEPPILAPTGTTKWVRLARDLWLSCPLSVRVSSVHL
jgi:hypothetical protein